MDAGIPQAEARGTGECAPAHDAAAVRTLSQSTRRVDTASRSLAKLPVAQKTGWF